MYISIIKKENGKSVVVSKNYSTAYYGYLYDIPDDADISDPEEYINSFESIPGYYLSVYNIAGTVIFETELKVCCECSKILKDGDNIITADDEDFCEECAENVLTTCECCGELVRSENLFEIHTARGYSEYWCESCTDDSATACCNCGEYFQNSEIIRPRGSDDAYCRDCACDNLFYCCRCEEWVTSDDWNDDEDCCEECAESDIIKSYHGSQKDNYIGACKKQWRGRWRGVGIELEIDSDSDRFNDETAEELLDVCENLVFEHDGSLDNGFEIITQPHTFDEFFKIDWEKILNICKNNNYTSHNNGNCGLHVHVSREMFGSDSKKQKNTVAKLLYFFAKNQEDIKRISRRADIGRWSKIVNVDSAKKAKDYASMSRYDLDRYTAINLIPRDTVEFRFWRGTLNYNSFIESVKITRLFIENAKKIRWKDIDDISLWISGADLNTKEYFKNKKAFTEVM